MSLPEDLIQHAIHLLPLTDQVYLRDVDLRRAVSASYYALFHQINSDAAALIAPNVRPAVNHEIQRWFDHGKMKEICGRFVAARLDQPLRALIGDSASPDLQTVARSFIQLQEARHSADYDPGFVLSWERARQLIELSVEALGAWQRIQGSHDANIFVLSLLMFKNWELKR